MRGFGILMLLVGLAFAQSSFAQERSYTVKRGETIRIFSWSFFGDTCRVNSYPKIRAVRGGNLGKIATGRGPIKVNRVSDTRLSNCIGKTVQGTIVTYKAGSQVGLDKITLARKRSGSKEARHQINVTVQ